ncbi:MAG TPA: hypothetical protein VGJ20_44610 [Xanthobacteraceae bacterium]|jgi:hypothetical protein
MVLSGPVLAAALSAALTILGLLFAYTYEAGREGYYGVPFSEVTVNGTVLVPCLASVIALFILLTWTTTPGLLLLEKLSLQIPLKHILTGVVLILSIIAFVSIPAMYFAIFSASSTVALLIVLIVRGLLPNSMRRKEHQSNEWMIGDGDDKRVLAILGVSMRVIAILLLFAFIAGRENSLHREFYLLGDGEPPCLVLADQGERFLCTSPDNPVNNFFFVAKTGAGAQRFTVTRTGPLLIPFGFWNTPKGRPLWSSWARKEFRRE